MKIKVRKPFIIALGYTFGIVNFHVAIEAITKTGTISLYSTFSMLLGTFLIIIYTYLLLMKRWTE